MSIFKSLIADHDRLRGLFDKVLSSEEVGQEDLKNTFSELRTELATHTKAEEDFVYPKLLAMEEIASDVREGIEEHRLSNLLLTELSHTELGSELWCAKIKALKDVVLHHLEEEEEDIFEAAGKAMPQNEQDQLNSRFLEKKKEFAEQLKLFGTINSDLIAIAPNQTTVQASG